MTDDSQLNSMHETQTSATLLMRVQDLEDHEAWAAFVQRYAPVIFTWCRRFHLQESDCADVTQDVLVKLMRSMQTFEYEPGRGRFRGWLKTVTANAVRDLARSWEGRIKGGGDNKLHQFIDTLQAPDAIESLTGDIEEQYKRELLDQAAITVKARVKAHTWQAWELTSVDGEPSASAAEKLGVAIGDVYIAKSRVNKMLADEVRRLQALDENSP